MPQFDPSLTDPALVEWLEPRQLFAIAHPMVAKTHPDVVTPPLALPRAATTASASTVSRSATALAATTFVHPSLLNTDADFARMRAKVDAKASPWIDSWNILIANSHAQLNYTPHPVATLIRGSTSAGPENYSKAMNDAAAAYQLALRWKISGDTRYADKAVAVLNAWGSTLTSITGDSNQSLVAGLQGYQFANAAEIMRSYSGWAAADFANFQTMMKNVFYAKNHDFLTRHHDQPGDHYWANWDLCNMASVMAIGVLLDDRAIYNEAVTYFKQGVGTGNIENSVYFLHPGKLGQWQESGRDQGHATLAIPLIGTICQMAWNQGDDLYGYDDNRVLAGVEYIARYNTGHDVPYITYVNSDPVIQTAVSSASRGTIRPGAALLYNHYVNVMGLAAPYTKAYMDLVGPTGGGGNYGPNSGGYDQLGFDTLTATLDPIAAGVRPSGLTSTVYGDRNELSWWGSAYATSYNIKRATSPNGPFTTIANVTGDTTFTDTGLVKGRTYYYVVSAVNPTGETAGSAVVSAVRNDRLLGTTIGSPGSYKNLGATINTVFDGGLRNYYDAANASGDWAGLDFGAGAANIITQVKYAPRAGFAGRMVGGKFQGSNTADFSSGVVTLYTIATAPAEGVLTTQNISNPGAFRYVRYVGGANSNTNVAEIQFFGTAPADQAPTLSAFGVNDGAAQRSMITSLTLDFDEPVTLGNDALTLLKNGSIPVNLVVMPVNGSNAHYLLTFSGAGIVGGSLSDGLYTLNLKAASILTLSGVAMSSDAAYAFHRLFGDSDGDKDVDGVDASAFNGSYRTTSAGSGYLWYFNYDGDGDVDGIDASAFNARYRTKLN